MKKLFKNLTIYLLSFLLTCPFSTQIHAMKRAQCSPPPSPSEKPSEEKYPRTMESQSWASLAEAEESEAESTASSSHVPLYPMSPELPDPLEVFDIRFLYNVHNGCKTLRIDPKREYTPGQKLNKDSLKRYLEDRRKDIFNSLEIENPKFMNIFKAFDIICIDNRIKTNPYQLLNYHNWLILRHRLNATVYINKSHLKKSFRKNADALRFILCFALYM